MALDRMREMRCHSFHEAIECKFACRETCSESASHQDELTSHLALPALFSLLVEALLWPLAILVKFWVLFRIIIRRLLLLLELQVLGLLVKIKVTRLRSLQDDLRYRHLIVNPHASDQFLSLLQVEEAIVWLSDGDLQLSHVLQHNSFPEIVQVGLLLVPFGHQ